MAANREGIQNIAAATENFFYSKRDETPFFHLKFIIRIESIKKKIRKTKKKLCTFLSFGDSLTQTLKAIIFMYFFFLRFFVCW